MLTIYRYKKNTAEEVIDKLAKQPRKLQILL